MEFFLSPPPPNRKKYPKKGTTFSIFEIFTVGFNHFFITKKWLNSAAKISKNEKSGPLFGDFFLFGGGG